MKYVLITAAKNEESYIEKTIQSVLNQTIKPEQWIIVSDGSTDSTESIVSRYASEYSFIKLMINDRREGRNFSSKVYALNIGFSNVHTSEYDYIGILDADVSFDKDYYSSLIIEFKNNSKLGIAGGIYYDIINGKKVPVYPSPYSVRGATQFFRKECFEKIDGIKPIKYGGEDTLACNMARMYGWEIKNIDSLIVLHHRPTGLTGSHIIRTRFRDGIVEYNLGYHPLFQLVKCLKRITENPFLVGSTLRFLGYWYSFAKAEKRAVSEELKDFLRREQLGRLIKFKY